MVNKPQSCSLSSPISHLCLHAGHTSGYAHLHTPPTSNALAGFQAFYSEPFSPHALPCLVKSPSFLSFKLANSPEASWPLHLCLLCDYIWIIVTYVTRKKFIYWNEGGWEGGGNKASLSRLFPWGSGLISRTHFPGTQTLGRISTWKGGRKKCKEREMWLCPVLKMSPYLLQSY